LGLEATAHTHARESRGLRREPTAEAGARRNGWHRRRRRRPPLHWRGRKATSARETRGLGLQRLLKPLYTWKARGLRLEAAAAAKRARKAGRLRLLEALLWLLLKALRLRLLELAGKAGLLRILEAWLALSPLSHGRRERKRERRGVGEAVGDVTFIWLFFHSSSLFNLEYTCSTLYVLSVWIARPFRCHHPDAHAT
jgi:hypothetical protein